jgi:hypothetical protein
MSLLLEVIIRRVILNIILKINLLSFEKQKLYCDFKWNETVEQLTALGEDIFRYFGLGCRNVSKIFVPKGYSLLLFLKRYLNTLFITKKYANNYDYSRFLDEQF